MKAQDSLERELENRLRAILGAVPGLGTGFKIWRKPAASDRTFDIMGELELPRTKDRVEFWVECSELPRPSQFPFVNLRNRILQHGPRKTVVPVLAAPHISPRMAELCAEHGWSWFDLAGNCRLVVPGALYIERTGLAAVHQRPRPKANLSSAASARVLRALLAPRNAAVNWSQTALRQHCEPGVSIGLVNKVVSHLRDEAWLEQRDDGKFRVKDAIGLLDLWRKSYRFERHRRIGYFTLLKPPELRNRILTMNRSAGEAVYAAFSAADFQAPCVRQNKTWLYVSDAALDEFVRIADAKRVDTGENLVVLVPEDDGVLYLLEPGDEGTPARTNPVQTWLDLRHVGGRGEEAAEAVLNQCLKPVWEGAARHV